MHGQLSYPEASHVGCGVVIAGPHPLLGGNMGNNVVRALGDDLAARECATLRFDYRGVGRSEGPTVDVAKHLAEFWQTSHVPDEMELRHDVQAAADFMREAIPGVPLILAGYSFGCALLPYLQPRDSVTAFVLIAPTIGKHHYDSFHPIQQPLLVIAAEDDFAINARQFEEWFSTLSMPRKLVRQRCDNHFFRGHENWLIATVAQFLNGVGGAAAC